jgi:hypothetical protein
MYINVFDRKSKRQRQKRLGLAVNRREGDIKNGFKT